MHIWSYYVGALFGFMLGTSLECAVRGVGVPYSTGIAVATGVGILLYGAVPAARWLLRRRKETPR